MGRALSSLSSALSLLILQNGGRGCEFIPYTVAPVSSCRVLLIILSPICLRCSPACFPAWFPKFGIGALSMVARSLCEMYSTVLQKAMNKNLSTFCWYLSIISTQRYTQFFFLTCTHTVFYDPFGIVCSALQNFLTGVPSIAAGIFAACSCSK